MENKETKESLKPVCGFCGIKILGYSHLYTYCGHKVCGEHFRLDKCLVCQPEENLRSKENLKPDNVNHPPHYTKHPSGVEAIEITQHYNFNVGNAIKYLWRSDHKNGVEDLNKAAWYVNQEIKRIEKYGK